MRKLALVVVALAGLSMAQSAGAVTQVWFTATGNNASSSVVTQGAPGGTLDLECNVQALPTNCSWTIQMLMNAPAADAGATGWANDFSSPFAPKVGITGLTVTTTPFNFNNQNGQPGTGLNLWTGAGAGSLSGVEGSNILLATFTLTKTKPTAPPPNGQPWAIFTSIGDGAYGCNEADPTGGAACAANFGFAPAVQMGANAPVPGFPEPAPLPVPVITGRNVPEPATAGLIGLGLLGLLRRRR